jgi:hypothetical protein
VQVGPRWRLMNSVRYQNAPVSSSRPDRLGQPAGRPLGTILWPACGPMPSRSKAAIPALREEAGHERHGPSSFIRRSCGAFADCRSVRMQLPPLRFASSPKPIDIHLDFEAETVDEILQRLTELSANEK